MASDADGVLTDGLLPQDLGDLDETAALLVAAGRADAARRVSNRLSTAVIPLVALVTMGVAGFLAYLTL